MILTNISRYTVTCIYCMFLATSASAHSWRIHHNSRQLPDFVDINAACTNEQVLNGDTLYLDPSCILTSDQNVTKQLTIIGNGYEGVTQPYAYASISGKLNLKAASIKVMSTKLSSVSIGASGIILERCRISGQVSYSGNSCSNATIRQCYMTYTTSSSSNVINGTGAYNTNSINWTIENNIIKANGASLSAIGALYNAIIRNNLIISNSTNNSYPTIRNVGGSQIINNIIINTGSAGNAVGSTDTGQLTNNVISQEIASDYNRVSESTDNIYTGDIQSYTLTEDSPAKEYGLDGTDCGIFGGMHPYVKGGRPFGHPYYTELKVNSTPDENDKLKISLKIKMQDE